LPADSKIKLYWNSLGEKEEKQCSSTRYNNDTTKFILLESISSHDIHNELKKKKFEVTPEEVDHELRKKCQDKKIKKYYRSFGYHHPLNNNEVWNGT